MYVLIQKGQEWKRVEGLREILVYSKMAHY
jgi:hypothetical protein